MIRIVFTTVAFRAAVLFGALLLILSGCTPRDRSANAGSPDAASGDAAPAYAFDVDRTLLAASVSIEAIGLTFSVPVGWEPIDRETRTAIERQIAGTDAAGIAGGELVELYLDGERGSALTVIALDPELGPRQVGAALVQSGHGEQVVFNHAGLEFVQVRTVTPELVSFALITRVPDRKPALLQYVVVQPADDRSMRAVESSIGSIRMD